VLLSGGADVFTYSSPSHGATHIIVDRPPHNIEGVVGARIDGCAYLQPQWCFDSLNWGITLPHAEYAPGAVLPPHVSPFYDDSADADGYVPDRVKELDQLVREKNNMVDITTLSVAAVKGLQEHGLLEAKDEAAAKVSSVDSLATQLAKAHATSLREELDLGCDEQEASESESSEINPDDFYRKDTRTLDAERLSEETRMRRAMLNATKARIYDRMVKENEEIARRRQELERRRDELRHTIELEKAKVAMGVDLRPPAPPNEDEQ
ncbi:Pescadillo, partial [Giardia duodenalis]